MEFDYIPEEIGLNTYNYGIHAASLDVVETLLQIELAKPKKSPIIIDLSVAGWRNLGDVSNYLPFTSDPRIRDLLRSYGAMEWRYYLPGIRYFGYYEWYLKLFINSRRSATKKVVRGFTHELDRAPVDPTEFADDVRRRLQDSYGYHPDEGQDQRLIESIAAHPERLFFLVYSPLHSSCYAHFENADKFEAFKARLKAIPNVVVIDWGRLDYPDDFFQDTTHLAEKGAVDFSRKLGAQIRETVRQRNN